MDENTIKVLLEISKNRRITTAELELKTKLSEMTVRKLVSNLQDKKLVTFATEGRSKLYSPLADFGVPNFKQSDKLPQTEGFSGKQVKQEVMEDSVRKVIKAVLEEADITKSEIFYYPIWLVNLEGRKIRIDGVSGKEV